MKTTYNLHHCKNSSNKATKTIAILFEENQNLAQFIKKGEYKSFVVWYDE